MFRCDDCQPLLFDAAYGLLDTAETAALEAHVASCADCAAAAATVAHKRGLIAQAAKSERVVVTFPPAVLAEPRRARTPARHWGRYALAASLLLAAGLFGVPAVNDGVATARARSERSASAEAAKRHRDELRLAQEERKRLAGRAAEQFAERQRAHDGLVKEWVSAERDAEQKATGRPFRLGLSGPATVVAGAPNEYVWQVSGKKGEPQPLNVRAELQSGGKPVYVSTTTPGKPESRGTLRIPPEVWADIPAGADLTLRLNGHDPRTGESSELAEPIQLAEPVHTTFLSTDKPLYRPGETIFFRSLTLDRMHFLPPRHDVALRFELRKPGGQPVENMVAEGLARAPGRMPNGEAVRGVGGGAFPLPETLEGGEYDLVAFEVPATGRGPASKRPVASRSLTVHRYTPERLLKTLDFDAKSYGPGDVVQARLVVTDQGKPVAGATVEFVGIVAGWKDQELPTARTGADGRAAVRWALPATMPHVADVRLSVKITTGADVEPMIRPVPMASRTLSVEFFPEGGDLVAGAPNRVYFRAATDAGKPAEVKGWLTDGTRDIVRLTTDTSPTQPLANQGLGLFTFVPEAGRRYAVRLDSPLGVVQPVAEELAACVGVAASLPHLGYALPAVRSSGIVLSIPEGVTEPGRPIVAELFAAGDAPRNVLVGAYLRGQSVAHARATLQPGRATPITLDAGADPRGGVVRVTVFEEPEEGAGRQEFHPVAERLVFRRPHARLNLDVLAMPDADPTRAGKFVPGDAVTLAIRSRREDGTPVPAVLWAAVVNQSTVTMADDRTERALPTHFLLTGEVRKPAELENADFLLTEHPDAARSLDRLLGTQGWRRFAEQAPELFQKQDDDVQEHLRVAMGGVGVPPASWGDRARKVFRDYQPKYDAALAELEAAERENTNPTLPDELKRRLAESAAGIEAAERAAYRAESVSASVRRRNADRLLQFGLALVLIVAVAVAARWGRKGAVVETLVVLSVGVILIGLLLPAPQKLREASMRSTEANRAKQAELERLEALEPVPAAAAPNPVPAGAIPRPPAPPTTKARTLAGADSIRKGSPRLTAAPGAVPAVPPGVAPTAAPRPTPKPPAGRGVPPALRQAVERAKGDGVEPAFAERFVAELAQKWPQKAPFAVREYAHKRSTPAGDGPRTDHTETLLWRPILLTGADGAAEVRFHLSDAVAPYRLLVAGHTLDGRLGSVTQLIEVRKPLEVDARLPPEIGSRDKLLVPVLANSPAGGSGSAELRVGGRGFDLPDGDRRTLALVNGGGRAFVALMPNQSEGTATVTVEGSSPAGSDSVERSVRIAPDGFPVGGSTSGTLQQPLSATVTVPKHLIRGTLKLGVTVYPNTLAELQGGLEGMLREPCGCFEQTSTTNYPNVLITQYLRERDIAAPEVSGRARAMLDRGYQRLAGYECPSTPTQDRRGFEWFGAADRQHDALTAYGLLQFTDMSKVHAVDPAMLRRTRTYLASLRDGNGGFRRDGVNSHAFGYAPKEVADAYIVWAVSEAEQGSSDPTDLSKEFAALLKAARSAPSGDPYFLALVANAALLRGHAAGPELLRGLASRLAADGSLPGAKTSITNSSGRNLLIETTALAALGWLKANDRGEFGDAVRRSVAWLGRQRSGLGNYGSTQATILTLKAIVENDRASKRFAESGELRLFADGKLVATQPFASETPGVVTLEVPDAERLLATGPAEVRLESTGRGSYPATIRWEAHAARPDSAEGCAVELLTALPDRPLAEGDATRLTVRVTNRAEVAQGMVVAVVGIPAGLQLPADAQALKELTRRKDANGEPLLSFWETRGRELVLYWRGLAPGGVAELGVDLIAHSPGSFRGPASCAYLYYDGDAKQWAEPLQADVRPGAGLIPQP